MKLPTMLLLDVKNEYEYYCLLRFMCYTKIIYFSRAKRKSQRKITRECIYIYTHIINGRENLKPSQLKILKKNYYYYKVHCLIGTSIS